MAAFAKSGDGSGSRADNGRGAAGARAGEAMTDETGYSLAAAPRSSFGPGRLFKVRARATIVKNSRPLNVRTSQSTEAKMVLG
jgi:hypothetical protein